MLLDLLALEEAAPANEPHRITCYQGRAFRTEEMSETLHDKGGASSNIVGNLGGNLRLANRPGDGVEVLPLGKHAVM